MSEFLAVLLCCLAATAAPAYTMFNINHYIVGVPDSQAGVIRLVIGMDEIPDNTFFFPAHYCHINFERPPSAWEYQRSRSAEKVELILRRVPGNHNQVVIDFNGNSQIDQRAGIVLEVVGSENTMGFDRVFDWMATDHLTHALVVNTFPAFSLLNALASDPVNGLILGNLNAQSEATNHLLPQRINIPGRLAVDAITRTPDSTNTCLLLSEIGWVFGLPEAPNRQLQVITQPELPGYSITRYQVVSGYTPPDPSPLPIVESHDTVSVNFRYVDRERLDEITRRGAGRHGALPEAHPSLATTYVSRLRQWFYGTARRIAPSFSVNLPLPENIIRARNDFYRTHLFHGESCQ